MNQVETYTAYKREEIQNFSGIYKITNLVNSKIYIGSAVCLYNRFRLHISDLLDGSHNNTHLQSAFNKYGITNFRFEVIKLCKDKELESTERYYIKVLNVRNVKIGYNKNEDPYTRLGAVLSEETKAKISNSLKGKKLPEKSLEKLKKIIREKIAKCIVQLDLNNNFIREWDCISDAAKSINVDTTNIVANLKKKTKTCRSYVFIYKDEYTKTINYSTKRGNIRNKVGKFDKSGNVIEIYENSDEAAKSNNIDKSCINNTCNYYKSGGTKCLKNKIYKGFVWKYI